MENFVKTIDELIEKINEGFEMILCIYNDTRGRYVACNRDDYKKVFQEVVGREFNDCDMAMPVEDFKILVEEHEF